MSQTEIMTIEELRRERLVINKIDKYIELLEENNEDILPDLKYNMKNDLFRTLQFFCKYIILQNDYIISFCYELVPTKNFLNLIRSNLDEYWLFFAVYQIFQAEDKEIIQFLLQQFDDLDVKPDSEKQFYYIIKALSLIASEYDIDYEITQLFDKIYQIFESSARAKLKMELLQLVGISGQFEEYKDVIYEHLHDQSDSKVNKKEKDEYINILDQIEKEQESGFQSQKKQFGRSYNFIESRTQLHKYYLVVEVFGDQLNEIIQGKNDVMEFLGFDATNRSKHDRNKDFKKQREKAKNAKRQ